MVMGEVIQQALELHHAGDLKGAERLYASILENEPQNSDALHLLGVISYQNRDFVRAEKCYRRALQINPAYYQAYSNLGILLTRLGRVEEAIQCYERALQLSPHDAGILNNLGLAQAGRGDLPAAIAAYREAICLKPDYAEAYNNLGNALHGLGQTDGAIRSFEYAVHLRPEYAEAYNNLANAFAEKAEVEEAVSLYHTALTYNNRYVSALNNLGKISREAQQLDVAREYYQKALQIDPHSAESHWGLAHVELLEGNFAEGWKEYEWRWEIKGCHDLQDVSCPRWDGSDITGKTILLYTEQGFGDAIQFARYIPRVAGLGAKVILRCQKELALLMKSLKGVSQVATHDEPLPHADVQSPLMSLPLVLRGKGDDPPSKTPYLTPPLKRSRVWLRKIRSVSHGLDVGVVWAGSPGHGEDRYRSLKLADLAPLAEIPGITFFSLQKGVATEQVTPPSEAMKLVDFTQEMTDFAETAACIRHLDLVITVDTAVAHLAGALGKPVWVLLPYAPDWRWQLRRTDSPWYPSMRLYRQPARSDWGRVIATVVQDLELLASRDQTSIRKNNH